MTTPHLFSFPLSPVSISLSLSKQPTLSFWYSFLLPFSTACFSFSFISPLTHFNPDNFSFEQEKNNPENTITNNKWIPFLLCQKSDKWKVKIEEQGKTEQDESSPLINLGLAIGGPTSSFDQRNNSCVSVSARFLKVGFDHHDQNQEREKQSNTQYSVVLFTEEQLQELKTQILIFKYIVSGLPVPIQFWRSFSSSFAHPVLGFIRLGSDNRYMMDPEPGRCRRTDGKKWRCHKPVVPNEKYCENHMHRGRKRSRKLVEASTGAASLNFHTLNPTNTNKRESPNNDFRIKFPPKLDHKPHLPTIKNSMSGSSSVRSNIEAKDAPTRVMIRAPSLNNTAVRIYDDDKQNDAGKINSNVKEGIAAIKPSLGLDFSPKSVLQGALRHPSVEKCENDPKSEPERCRRTDGKRWRCSNEVLPHQKYCANHMNRGAKKPVKLMSTSGKGKHAHGSAPGPESNGPERAKWSLSLNTNLNFSFTSSSSDPQQNIEDDSVAGSGGSGSTTETTVTDDSTDVVEMITLSP